LADSVKVCSSSFVDRYEMLDAGYSMRITSSGCGSSYAKASVFAKATSDRTEDRCATCNVNRPAEGDKCWLDKKGKSKIFNFIPSRI